MPAREDGDQLGPQLGGEAFGKIPSFGRRFVHVFVDTVSPRAHTFSTPRYTVLWCLSVAGGPFGYMGSNTLCSMQ